MKWLFALFKTLKMVMRGEVVARMDTQANSGVTTMSLRLKRDRASGDYYVVLAELSNGSSNYVVFTRDEFRQFSEAVSTIQNQLIGYQRT
jgi:hypothetical protein